MSPQKTKNLIILILVLVNLFLLALVVPTKVSQRNAQAQALEKLSRLYAQSGIELDPAILPEDAGLHPLMICADAEQQAAAVKAFLGETMTRKQEGDALHYTSPVGEAVVEHSLLSAKLSLPAEDAISFTQALLQQMNIPFAYLQETKTVGGCVIAARLQVQARTVFNESLVFTYSGGFLTAVNGLLLPESSDLYTTSANPGLGLWDALVKFRSSRITAGWMVSAVTSVEQGYILEATADGQSFSLIPRWRIETDMGPYAVDGVSGEVSATA